MNVDDSIMIGEDACVSYAAMLKSKKVSIINNSDYHYRQHEASMLKKNGNYNLEIKRLKALYKNLLIFTRQDKELKRQVEEYVLVNCIIRSGGLYPNSGSFVFGDDFINKKIVVYSAGTFGQLFVSKILENHSCKLVGWIDDDYWEYRRCCLNVDPVEDAITFDFDYLIVAAVDEELSDDIRKRLIHLGINENKIVTLDIPTEKRATLLKAYLGDN